MMSHEKNSGRDSKNKQVIEKINALLEEIRNDLKSISV